MILSNQASPFLVIGIFRVVINQSESLWDDRDQQIQHHYICIEDAQDEKEPSHNRLDARVEWVSVHVSQTQAEAVKNGISIVIDELAIIFAPLTQSQEGLSETKVHNEEHQQENFDAVDHCVQHSNEVAYKNITYVTACIKYLCVWKFSGSSRVWATSNS